MDDLEQAIRFALEPLTTHGQWEMCPHCGATMGSGLAHTCRTHTLDIPGLEHDPKSRARSYCVS